MSYRLSVSTGLLTLLRLLTIVVNFAVVVLVPVFHQFLNVVLRDCLPCGLQHHFQLIQVDVTICVPAQSGEQSTLTNLPLSLTDGTVEEVACEM